MVQELKGPYKLPSGNKKPEKLVVFLHGVGSDGYDLIGLADDFEEIIENAVFLSPNAPFKYENFPTGYQWFSLSDYNPDKLYHGIKQALPILKTYIDKNLEKYSLEYKDLVLVGFSQGAMMSVQLALRLPNPCLAVISFSGAIIKPEELVEDINSKPYICLIHGENDHVVPISKHHASVQILKNIQVPFKEYILKDLAHSINLEALKLAKNFLSECLSAD